MKNMTCYKNGGCGVYENRSCSECPASKPGYVNKTVNPNYVPPATSGYIKNEDFDRQTALRVLNDLSSCMYPSFCLFGRKTLVINRVDFEKVRAKYLDRKENNQ